MFPLERVWDVFHHADKPGEESFPVTLYGEGYGAKIQKGGGNYRDDQSFRLFDVQVGRKWLDWPNVEDVAHALGIDIAPVVMHRASIGQAVELVEGFTSYVSREDGKLGILAEGVVARTIPYLYDWRGDRIMWKLKTKDIH
jgi:hypothetical protein